MDLVKNCKIIDFNIIYTLNICLSKEKGLICSVYLVLRYYFSLTVKTHVHNAMHLVELLFFLYLISVCSRIFLYPKTCVYKYDVITTYNEFSFLLFMIYIQMIYPTRRSPHNYTLFQATCTCTLLVLQLIEMQQRV